MHPGVERVLGPDSRPTAVDIASTHLVLKNFPSESELRSLVADLGEHAAFTSWRYYWAFEYRVA